MRTTIFVLVTLTAISLTVRTGATQWCQAGKPRPRPAPVQVEEGKSASWDVKGYGRSREEAEQDALEKARSKVTAYLRRQEPPLFWSPTAAYVRDHLADTARMEKLDDVDIGEPPAPVVKVQCWRLPVIVTPARYLQMVRENRDDLARQQKVERDARAVERMLLLGKVMGGILALLVGVGGYIRLDDWTKGVYTSCLGVGLGGVVGVVIVTFISLCLLA